MSKDLKLGILFLSLTAISVSTLSTLALSLPSQTMSSPAASSDSYTANVYGNMFTGSYLVNRQASPLYYYSDDSNGGGVIICNDGWADIWQPFYASSLSLPETLRSVDFEL